MLTPEQQQLFSSVLTGLGPDFMQSLGGFLQPQSQEGLEATFQKSYVDPALQTFEQRSIPAIQQAFSDANAGSSSALNQALASSAKDLSTSLGAQFGNFQQNQQNQQLQAISQFLPLVTGGTFSPVIEQKQGILGPLLSAGGQIGATALAASSKEVKENVREYKKATETLMGLDVKQYDYISRVGGAQDRVGLIAENVPEELTASKDGILHVDLYGVLGLLINSVQDLARRIDSMEAA